MFFELGFWSPFPMGGFLAHPWCMREGPGPTSTSYARLCWYQKGDLVPSKECMWGWAMRRWGGWEKRRERELGLVYKVKKKKANLKNAFNDQSKNAQMQIFPKYFFSIKLESTGRKRQPYSHRKEKPLMWVMMQRVGNLMK